MTEEKPDKTLEKTLQLAASPDQVWQAIATGPGISAWFVPTQVADGVIRQDFGSGNVVTGQARADVQAGTFRYGAADGAGYAFEFFVRAHDGGGTVLRFVQSGFGDNEGWEAEYDGFDTGWDLFFGNLAAYLRHFAGQPAAGVAVMGWAEGITPAQAWPVFYRGLGLAGRPEIGDRVRLTPDGPAPIEGVVDVSDGQFLGVRSEHGLHRIGAEGTTGCGVSAYHYFYGVDVDTAAATAAWQAWLTRLFPSAQPVG
jgi:uncharacterized protein YndB with AHSA1/START domain